MKSPKIVNLPVFAFVALLLVGLSTTSCNEDEDIVPVLVSVDDAAELVAFSMANRTYGSVNNLNYVTEEILDLIDCDESRENQEAITETSFDGEINVNYDLTETYSKTCSENETINYSFNIDQSLTSPRYDLEQDISGSWIIQGLEENSSAIIYNGPYNRSGLWTYNLRENHTDDVTYESTFNNLTYDPNTERITGGSASFTLDGTSTIYEPFNFAGEVEFQGGDISIITFNSGEQYELNLETGEINQL